MARIKLILALAACLIVSMTPALAQEPTLLTPEEIWQDGASWEEVWDSNPVYYHFFVDGTIEHEGKTYLKIKYYYQDFWDHEIPCCGIRVEGDKVSVLADRNSDGTESGCYTAFPYCDFNDIGIGRSFRHSWVRFNNDGEPIISDYEYPVLKSKSVLECPELPGRALEIYSTGDDVYTSWDEFKTKMIVPGLGAISCFGGLIDPFLAFIPAVGWSVQTLWFKDGQGREIFRHPHYDRIMELISAVDDVMTESEPVCNVYSISGSLVLTDATPEQIDCLPRGIYIKRQGNKTEKIMVR